MKKILRFFSLVFVFSIFTLVAVKSVLASPIGSNYFEIFTNKQTGADNSGDGGTGNSADFNYYYVGQSFTGNISIESIIGSNAANIWIDYNTSKANVSGLTTGTYFPFWASQSISGGRVKSTGYRVSGYSTGVGNFGSVNVTVLSPSEASYGANTPAKLTINVGTLGATTESNISRDGDDILDSKEDFQFHIWADTRKPYAKNPNPANGVSGVSVEAPFSFELRDSKLGEGNDSGVGTGLDLATPPGNITANDGSGAENFTDYASYSCSGIWGTNFCNISLTPPSPLGVSGDNRKWKYGTNYILTVSGYRDRASNNQSQLGDANGPNTMDNKTWTFTTESDNVKPQVLGESPSRGSGANSVDTSISIDIADKKTYPGDISGTGVNPATCKINITSPSHALTTYQQGSSGLTVTPIGFGYRYTVTPSQPFAQSETISVVVYDCADNVSNVMIADNYTFSTADTSAPYVDGITPANDGSITADGTISFHIKDDGEGVDLLNTIIFINGIYYTNSGGAGSVTTTGTRIIFSGSLNFNGGNYTGDTTGVSVDIHDRVFTIKPPINFTAGEAVPVIIYTRDTSGNVMERLVYSLVVTGGGGGICSGQTFCGTNTSWNGTSCVGAGGGGGTYVPSCPEESATNPQINLSTFQIVQVDERSVLITFFSSVKGNAWVSYGTTSLQNQGSPPNYGYQYNSGSDNANSTYHSIVIENLESGQLYYFIPVFQSGEGIIRGAELKFTPRFAIQTTVEEKICKPEILEKVSEKIIIRETIREVPQNCPPGITSSPGASGAGSGVGGLGQEFTYSVQKVIQGAETVFSNENLSVFDFPAENTNLDLSGKTVPFGNILVIIY